MVGKTALNKEMKHLNGAYFRTNHNTERGIVFYQPHKYTITNSRFECI